MSGTARPFPGSCLDPFEIDALPLQEASRRLLDALPPPPTVVLMPLRNALGRILAEDVRAPFDVPSSTNAAMDGYAVHSADVREPDTLLRVAGRALAGHPFDGRVETGSCVQIMTGAPMPAGADAVVPHEHTERQEGGIRIGVEVHARQNVREAGEDLAKGEVALAAGTRLLPAELGLLASIGRAEVRVHRPLRVAFFSTGDELRSIGEVLGPGEIYDSNRYVLFGMLQRLGVQVLDLGVVRDRPQDLRAALIEAGACADVIITSGGVSVGDADFVRRILSEVGEVAFYKLAMKPGRPFSFGHVGKAVFFGLPGNPVAVMVTFYQLVQPALLRLAGAPDAPVLTFPAIALERLRKKPGRTEFVRGILARDEDGRWTVRRTGQQGSGVLNSMSRADCFVILPDDRGTVEPGELVEVQPLAALV